MSTEPFESSTSARPPSEAAAYESPYAAYSEWSEEEVYDAEYAYEPRIAPQQLATALGWFSIGLGLAEILAPRTFGRAIGVGEHPGIIRALGVGEIASGLGLLSQRSTNAWAWSRVGGDAMNLALLGAAARNADANPQRIAMTASAVMGVAAVDVYASR